MAKNTSTDPNCIKISPFIEDHEQLLTCGTFQTRISVIDRSPSAEFSDLANRNHIIGVTEARLIVIPLERNSGNPIAEEVQSVQFGEVKIENDGLLIRIGDQEKPIKYFYVFGYKVSKEQFSIFFPNFLEAVEIGVRKSR